MDRWERDATSSLSPLLSSGACEALEEFRFAEDYTMSDKDQEDLSEWVSRTRAPHLRALSSTINSRLATTLTSSDVAPRLQVLHLHVRDTSSLPFLSQAIGGGAWPHLRELSIEVGKEGERVPDLVEAIGVGAPKLVSLRLCDDGIGREGGMAVARMLRYGGCPRLVELDLTHSDLGNDAVVELAKALEGGAPCNTTIQRLNLSCCVMTAVGMKELMESMGRGALPHLECLDVGLNASIKDRGVVTLAQAMAAGSLRSLQGLYLWNAGVGQRGAKALFQAFRDYKPCPHLKWLSLEGNEHNEMGDGGVVHLAVAIEAGALQHLQELDVSYVGMGDEGFKALIKAMVAQEPNPGCPRLEVLNVKGNEDIGDDGVTYLAEVMKKAGAFEHLQELVVGSMGAGGHSGVALLLEALGRSGVCPNLQNLYFHTSEGAVDDCIKHLTLAACEMNSKRSQDRFHKRVNVLLNEHDI